MAGYSPRSLADKLGIKEGHKALLVLVPPHYEKTLGPLPGVFPVYVVSLAQARAKSLGKRAPFNFIQCFCGSESELEMLFPVLKGLLAADGMLWVCWRKKTKGPLRANAVKGAGAKTAGEPAGTFSLGENQVRELGLSSGLVDVKVCAVDDTWSGLKFMFRRRDRPK